MSEVYEKILETCKPRGQFKQCYWYFADTIGRNEKIFFVLLSSQISGRMYNTVVSIQCMIWKFCHSLTLCRCLKTIIDSKWQKQVRWVVLGLSQEGACTELFENFSENSLKGDQSNDTKFNPPLFSLVNTFKCFFGWSLLINSYQTDTNFSRRVWAQMWGGPPLPPSPLRRYALLAAI